MTGQHLYEWWAATVRVPGVGQSGWYDLAPAEWDRFDRRAADIVAATGCISLARSRLLITPPALHGGQHHVHWPTGYVLQSYPHGLRTVDQFDLEGLPEHPDDMEYPITPDTGWWGAEKNGVRPYTPTPLTL